MTRRRALAPRSRVASIGLIVALLLASCAPAETDDSVVPPPPVSTSTTTAPVTTTTAPPAPEVLEVLWSGEETDDWFSTAISGDAFIEDVDHPVLGPSLRLVNQEVDGTHSPGARINHQGFGDERVLPTEAWYSATFFIPYFIDGQDNVFQFKQGDGSTRKHLWNVGWKPVDGELRLIVRTRLDGDTWVSEPTELAVLGPVPIGEPFRIEVFRRISTGPDGQYEVRLDGETVWEFEGPTAASNLEERPEGNQEWVLSHYLGAHQGEVTPATSEIYMTDAKITDEAESDTDAA